MVTRVYHPVYPNPAGKPRPGAKKDNLPNPALEPPLDSAVEEASQNHYQPVKPSDNLTQNPTPAVSPGNPQSKSSRSDTSQPDLATLRDQQAGKPIQLDSILSDFEQTLNALGLQPAAQQQLQPYLNVVRLQGQETAPNVSLIKSTLLSASKTLDGWIAKATNAPSDVVTEWMKTLLSQEIRYSSTQPVKPGAAPDPTPSADTPNTVLATTGKPGLKQWLAAAKHLPADQAIPVLQQALQQVPADQPGWTARIQAMLARRHWQTGDQTAALQWMASAVQTEPDSLRQAQHRVMLAHWQGRLNQQADVVTTLAPVVMDNELQQQLGQTVQARAWLDYGQALTRQQAEEAVPALKRAILLASRAGQHTWEKEALPSLASAYLHQGDAEAAFKVLQRHQRLKRELV